MTISTPTVQDQTEATDLIECWAHEEPQTLVSRKLVIDRLLDLRNLLPGSARSDLDAILANVPGVTVVEGSWWAQQLTAIAARLDTPEAGPTS